ncbi:MAG: S8 family serine peptidase, partial [Candidatus Paceibacterota bacterium]
MKKVFNVLFVLIMGLIFGQSGIVGFVSQDTNSQNREIFLSSSATLDGSGAHTKAANNGMGVKGKKEGLSEARKKIGTDLLKLIDDEYLLPAESRSDVIHKMKDQRQYVGRNEKIGESIKRVNYTNDELVYVYIYLKSNSPTSVIDSLAWEVTNRDEEFHMAVAYVKLGDIEWLASLQEVKSMRTVIPAIPGKGSVMAQSDVALRTAEIKNLYGQQGNGVKIGVISDGAHALAEAQASGDLPSNVQILRDSSTGVEGVAMMEVIYDMVPGASLYFSDGGANIAAQKEAYDLLLAAGCKVIVDDLFWPDESYFEDGYLSYYLSSYLASKDIVLVSNAGNYAGTHYQGMFYDDGTGHHDFSRGSSSSKNIYISVPPGQKIRAFLQWNDGFGSSGNDYDMEFYDADTNKFLIESTNTQDGDDCPFEAVGLDNDNTARNIKIVVSSNGAEGKILEIVILVDGNASSPVVSPTNLVSADSIMGHAATKGVIATGAINVQSSGYTAIESYSSRGPVTINGEGLRAKPDICGVDGISVSGAGGFDTVFSGTSAAAPTVAAVVAQLWGAFPTLKGNVIRDTLLSTAIDVGASGFDYACGHGRADAVNAYKALAAIANKSSEKTITSFKLGGVSGTINNTTHTILVALPAGTSVTSLAPTISLSAKATISPTSGTAKNFSSPVTYTVTAEDGSTQTYNVTVTVETVALSSIKNITSFKLGGVSGTINNTTHTILVALPAGTSVTSLAPTISLSAK